MLTECVAMPGIIALIRRIYRKPFKCIYLKNSNFFVNTLMHFSNQHKIVNIFSNKIGTDRLSISEVIDCEKRGCLNE